MEWIILIIAGIAFIIYKSNEANARGAALAKAVRNEEKFQLLCLMYEVLNEFNMRNKHFTIPNQDAFWQSSCVYEGNGMPSCYVFRLSFGYGVLAKDISKDLKRHLQEGIDGKIYQFPRLNKSAAKHQVYLADVVILPKEAQFKVFINDNPQVADRIQYDLKQESERKQR